MNSNLQLYFLLLFEFTIATNPNHTRDEIAVREQVLPLPNIDEGGFLISTGSLPDWSDVKRKSPHYIEVLLVVDSAISRHYGHELERIRAAMLTLMHAVNMYAFQLDIRITVVDVVPMYGHNVTLENFLEWRQSMNNLVTHDLAILVRHRYEGGIAYVNGVCKRTAVGITGFFPEAPYEYASVFFHELSHLLGLSHNSVADCRCSRKRRGSCLRIDGFEHECSAQALVDLLPSIECLVEPLHIPRTVLALCGNGIVEEDEDCDCGPARYCINAFCEPRTCHFIVNKQYLYTTITFGTAFLICGSLILIKQTLSKQKDSMRGCGIETSSSSPLSQKPMLLCADSSFINPAKSERLENSLMNTSQLVVQKDLGSSTLPSPQKFTPSNSLNSLRLIGQTPTSVSDSLHQFRKPRMPLTLDSEIPLTEDVIIISEYVPMNPSKTLIQLNSGRLQSSNLISTSSSGKMLKPSQILINSSSNPRKIQIAG